MKYVQDTYGGEWEAAPSPGTKPGALTPAFSEMPRDAVDDLVDQATGVSAPAIDDMVSAVRAIVHDATDFAEVQRRLLTLNAGGATERLAEAIGQALILAHLDGVAEADSDA